jgi:site-specific DNA-methyltransferase (cytosine-N4-specific)
MGLQANGWYLRSDIIWHKPNPMPESVTDRPTKAHEYIFLLTKSERYFYDAESIMEQSVSTWNSAQSTLAANGIKNVILNQMGQRRTAGADTFHRDEERSGRNKRSVWTVATQPYAEAHFATFPEEIPKLCILAGSKPGDTVLDPFAGSGTVGKVALELGRRAILIELNPAYVELIRDRTWVTPGMF